MHRRSLVWRTLSILIVLTLVVPSVWLAGPARVAQALDTGWRGPTADLADTGGDDDGFEDTPTGAYADGGGFAGNLNGRADRHRFYDFGLTTPALPPGAVITGIEVRLDGWADSTSNNPRFGVELSWNDEGNWTAVRETSTLSTTQSTRIVGGPFDTWGRTWTPAEVANANFVVRITSLAPGAGGAQRDFFLDWVAVRVYYATSGGFTGTVWQDDNGNGAQDGSEPGLGDVPVTFYLDDGDGVFEGGAGDIQVDADLTDGNGLYASDPLLDGFNYWIAVTEPPDYELTTPPEPRLVSLPDANPVTVNFGYRPGGATNPAVAIDKTPDLQLALPGATVTFTITVTNTGDALLADVTIVDALAPNCNRLFPVLPVGEQQTYTCTRANVTSDFTNSATVTALPVVGLPVSDTDTAVVDVINPGIDIAKTPDTQMVVNGSTVTFTIALTNTGDVALANVTVSDAQAPNCNRVFASLAAGARQGYTCTRANATADFTNSATITGTSPLGNVVSDADTAFVDVINPAIAIDKSPDLQTVRSGSPVTFTIALTNTGDVPLTNVLVSDPFAPNCARAFGSLAVGASQRYTCTLQDVVSAFTNQATATCTAPNGALVSDADAARVELDESPQCPADMVAYWKLDEAGSTTYADFFDGHTGSCAGACPTPTTGRLNGGQLFNGTSTGLNVPPHADFNWLQQDSFSIEYWMKTDSASTCAGHQVVIGRDSPEESNRLHWWTGCIQGGQAGFFIRDKNDQEGFGVIGTSDVTDGAWHHIVAVRDGSLNQMRLYVDGVHQAMTPSVFDTDFDSLTIPLNIGWFDLPSSKFRFAGVVDELAVYSRALPLDEIQQHYMDVAFGRGYCSLGGPAPDIRTNFLPVVLKNR